MNEVNEGGAISVRELEQRIKSFAAELKRLELDAAILFGHANIRYFTDLRMNPSTDSIAAIASDGQISYLVAPLDYKRAIRNCWIKDISVFPEDSPNSLLPLKEIFAGKKIHRIGIEPDAATFRHIQFLNEICSAELAPIDEILTKMRAVKTQREIELIRKAAAIADAAMGECRKRLKAGLTEAELTGYARFVFEREGGEGASFDPFLMSGKNSWLPQRFSSSKKIEAGDMAVFDMGAVYCGYCSDLTRTFHVGTLSKEQQRVFEVAYQAQQKAIEAIKPGVTAGYIDSVARGYINEAGYGEFFPHITGHGIGISIHEQPILSAGNSFVLEKNMALTIEPGIYMENVGAARVEDMALVTESGCDLLTESSRDL